VTRSIKLFAVAVLAIVLALSSAQNAFATVELAYDSGVYGLVVNVSKYVGVLFSLPSGVSSARLVYVRWADFLPNNLLTIHITGPDHATELSGSPIALPGADPAGTGCPAGWTVCYGLDLTSYGIVVTGDFFIILSKTADSVLEDNDLSAPGRSYTGSSLLTLTSGGNLRNLLIRVDIDPIYPAGAPVGGFMEPVDKLAVFAPYLALFGVIAAVAIVVVKPWKKREN